MAGAAAVMQASPYRLAVRLRARSALREYVSFSTPLFVASASRVLGAQAVLFAGESELGSRGPG